MDLVLAIPPGPNQQAIASEILMRFRELWPEGSVEQYQHNELLYIDLQVPPPVEDYESACYLFFADYVVYRG